MSNRKLEINYKNLVIEAYKGSNFVYVGKRVFDGVISAKRHITKVLKYFDNDIKKVKNFYNGE